MSQEDVEVVRRGFDAFGRGDTDTTVALLHPEIEWYVTDVFVETPVHRGREQAAAFMQEFVGAWEDFHIELDELSDLGEAVLVSGRFGGRGHSSGIEIDVARAWVLEVRDGMIWRWRSFTSRAEALEAVGSAQSGVASRERQR
jgi:ketosteroid isomerase-like protein